jgi:hypothetical protein
MKTLRLLRNIAALFILVAAMLVWGPRLGLSGSRGGYCVSSSSTIGWNCVSNTNGGCSGNKCTPGTPCNDTQCQISIHFPPF